MTEWMKTILSLSLSGSAVIAATGLLCLLVRGRAGWRWRYYVWLIAAARLLLPFSPAGSPAEELTVRAERRAVQAVEAVEISAPETEAASTPETPPGLRELGALALENLWAVWLAGALALGVRKVTAYRSFKRYLRAGWTAVEDPAALDLAAEAGALAGVRRPVEVYVNPLAAVPVLVGTVRPVVVLPSAEPGEDLFCVLLHELTHCRRGDILYKGLVQLTVCVHWFNPLVHWMARETERACELSCDEAVLGLLDESGRRAYGGALLRSVEAGGGYGADAPAATLGKAGKLLKERLDAIMHYKKLKRSAAALSLALAALVGLTAAAAGAYTGGPGPEPRRPAAQERLKDDDWDWDDDDWDWDWDDEKWAEQEKRLAEEYAAHGVTMDGKKYYYRGELVNVFLDQRADESFYTLDRDPKGTVSIKIVRDKTGEITGVEKMTPAEAQALFSDGDEHVVDVDIERVDGGAYVWLATFEMEEGDTVWYDLTAEKGDRLTVGFAKAGEKKPRTTYMTVSSRRADGALAAETGPMTWEDPLEPGEYSLFIQAKDGPLEGVSGYVTVREAD